MSRHILHIKAEKLGTLWVMDFNQLIEKVLTQFHSDLQKYVMMTHRIFVKQMKKRSGD